VREGGGTALREVSHLERPLPVQRGEGRHNACMPCHKERVENATAHTRHKADSPGNKLHLLPHAHNLLCPDESKRPLDAPADTSATIAYKSPNACNLCHMDKDASWRTNT